MTYTNMGIRMGEVVVLTEGAYSDYGIAGFIVALKNFDIGEKVREFAKEIGQNNEYCPTNGFAGWLIAKELVLPVEYREIQLGAYGRFDDEFGLKPPKE